MYDKLKLQEKIFILILQTIHFICGNVERIKLFWQMTNHVAFFVQLLMNYKVKVGLMI
jgi:hypothetical protein